MAAECFRHSAGLQGQHIPFRGPTEAFVEVVSGRVDFYFVPLLPALNLVKDGKVLALMVGATKRAALLPDVPTSVEVGLPDAAYQFWGGLFVPAKTPREIVNKLHDETQKALSLPAIQERLSKLGVEPLPMSVAQFEQYFRDDVAATVKLAKDVGIVPTN